MSRMDGISADFLEASGALKMILSDVISHSGCLSATKASSSDRWSMRSIFWASTTDSSEYAACVHPYARRQIASLGNQKKKKKKKTRGRLPLLHIPFGWSRKLLI